jgi:hypothetical protein
VSAAHGLRANEAFYGNKCFPNLCKEGKYKHWWNHILFYLLAPVLISETPPKNLKNLGVADGVIEKLSPNNIFTNLLLKITPRNTKH